MSYFTMDHAGWVEQAKRIKLTDFQARVVDIVGIAGGGIYNAPIDWKRVDWHYSARTVLIPWQASFSTWDFSRLTTLVLLCHAARIRLEISPRSRVSLDLVFSERSHAGGICQRHPDIDEAVASLHSYLPKTHRLIYRDALAPADA